MRHGQAGTRDSYDSLSQLGRRQSRLLGEYFVSQGTEFAAAYSGAMLRQQQTAAEVSAAYTEAGVPFPEIVIDNDWNEFDLAQVYREIGPLLCEEDAEFRSEYEEMRRQVSQSAGVHDAEVHRRWRQANILAFTSATPTGILTGLALDIPPGRVRQLAGVLLNASYTVLRQRGEHLQLFQFNAVPHLSAPELRTHR